MEDNNWESHWIDLAKKQVLINNYYIFLILCLNII
jgi:hypothetical protein